MRRFWRKRDWVRFKPEEKEILEVQSAVCVLGIKDVLQLFVEEVVSTSVEILERFSERGYLVKR